MLGKGLKIENNICCIFSFSRSYGVLLWEIVTYGKLPLVHLDMDEVVRQAESKKLVHPRLV